MRSVDPRRVDEQVEVGRDGLAVARAGHPPVVLLAPVACELRAAGAKELLARLERKARITNWLDWALYAVRTEDIVVRSAEPPARTGEEDPQTAAGRWLANLVEQDGSVAFAVDARRGKRIATGPMHHGRAAVALRALERDRRWAPAASRARRWLEEDIEKALRGEPIASWPDEPAMIAGTLALACLAGIDLRRELTPWAERPELRASPWHGAQVVVALGREAPDSLWRACVAHLSVRPWAPWTVLAARARGEADVAHRASRALCESIRSALPFPGGCSATRVPETALTALVVEALHGSDDEDARAVVARARRFLRAAQLTGDSIPAPLDPDLAQGAFVASPVHVDYLRCDVSGHAFLALAHGGRRAR
jgi:hypothetical protein